MSEEELTAEHRVPEAPPADELEDEPPEPDAEGSEPSRPAPLDLVRISALGGVPLFYKGNLPAPRPHRPWVARSFLPTLEATVRQMRARIPESYGQLLRIQEIGMYVAESDKLHTKGRACDWEKLVFEHVQVSPGNHEHAAASRSVRCRYWGFAAICRSNSCYVLHGLYNRAHENHIHQDDAISKAFNTKPATVKLCQAILNEVFAQSPKLRTDGDYGDLTRRAMESALRKLQIDGTVHDVQAWTQFLRTSARLAFHMAPPA